MPGEQTLYQPIHSLQLLPFVWLRLCVDSQNSATACFGIDPDDLHSLNHSEPQNATRLRTQREANTNFADALGDNVGHHTVHSCTSEN